MITRRTLTASEAIGYAAASSSASPYRSHRTTSVSCCKAKMRRVIEIISWLTASLRIIDTLKAVPSAIGQQPKTHGTKLPIGATGFVSAYNTMNNGYY